MMGSICKLLNDHARSDNYINGSHSYDEANGDVV